ncbi:SDR family oxidoreductase [Kutzneria sp. CA-103260]|uniref:SDR family oxidoreductase n=1 Tax=Kutzneria sp. CA-103260 TaxID=2802641 RepID=UPI001BA9B991|nr:SDR family oxidoreductase [Kutzneria sp. CA-103260]QUQ65791.1 oxidoreductase [Kutzneria sp. CA-103260]
MRVFVTGASGHVGSAVIPELQAAGHQVVGLARSDASAAALAARGVEVRRGDLDSLDVLHDASADADGVIHLAFKHDAMIAGDLEGAAVADLAATRAIADALAGTGKPLVGTSGTGMLALADHQGIGTEDVVLPGGYRVDTENLTIELAGQGIRSSVLRLPPTVHSSLDKHGFVPTLIGIARAKGVSGYIGDGANVWPAGHTLDVARLYRLALEHAPAGSRLHAVDDEGVSLRQIAEAIGRHLGVPAASIAPENADDHFGWFARFAAINNPASSARTQQLLDWKPEHPGLLADIDEGHYFAVSS